MARLSIRQDTKASNDMNENDVHRIYFEIV